MIQEASSPRSVLVIGWTGFVAQGLIPALRQEFPNALLFGVARTSPSSPGEDVDRSVTLDVRDRRSLQLMLQDWRPEAIVHLASRKRGTLGELFEVNVMGTEGLLDLVRRNLDPETPVVVVGSSAEIGLGPPKAVGLKETCLCRPVNGYGISKLAQSHACAAAHWHHGQHVVRVRLFNVIGPNPPAHLLLGRCVALLREGRGGRDEKVTFTFGDLSAERDYIDVADAGEAISAALRKGTPGRLYHVGSGMKRTAREVVETFFAVAREETRMVPVSVEIRESLGRPPGVPSQVADPRRAMRELGWRPLTSFRESIRRICVAAGESPEGENGERRFAAE